MEAETNTKAELLVMEGAGRVGNSEPMGMEPKKSGELRQGRLHHVR